MKSLKLNKIVFYTLLVFFSIITVSAQQININRIEQMPNTPSPYEIRDWDKVAIGYDSLVFNFNLTGEYLPLVWLNTNTVNYPFHNSFGLHTYVGTAHTSNAEAINLLPAVVGASLVGIDKSNQSGHNWVLYCEEFFNNRPDEYVYLNSPVASSGSDWWYDTMPNIFFYQLNYLYPSTGDFDFQFATVADRWLEAVKTMGGSSTPWKVPYMNYRGWYLASMTPNSAGVREPEAAGALAWILYNAFVSTGIGSYRIGAEWSMEFLNNYPSNPSYELQLAYGTYAAARMNAELGTTYDIEKLINWNFNIGPLRNWGAIIGTWGGLDVHGLIGEVNGFNDYAFAMNSIEQVGALVPLVRYDDRFARAIGKWILNVSNASRLFYSNYLPGFKQDNEDWTNQYDPNSYIGYEALRETHLGQRPYATGDAMIGGWAATNLALYGSSHVGILGGIIGKTNVEMILQLDLLKTDYYHDDAYPSYLYYNPYGEDKVVNLDVGSGQYDIYDAVSNSFLSQGVTSNVPLRVPTDNAILAVIVPVGGSINYDLDKMLIDGVVVDYLSGVTVENYPPRIKSLVATPDLLLVGDSSSIYCTAEDRDDDTLTYSWSSSGGTIIGSGKNVLWIAADVDGSYYIVCQIEDGYGNQIIDSVKIDVAEIINNAPVIQSIIAQPRKIHIGSSSQLTCIALDPDGDNLSYSWSSGEGTFSGSGKNVIWIAPIQVGNYFLNCSVEDTYGSSASDSLEVSVRDTSLQQSGDLVAYYPFSGNANDESGFDNHGTVIGAQLVSDRFNNPNSAYRFDGMDDKIEVLNSPSLNFQNSCTINFWMTVGEFFDREAHPLSHGSWQNRWKVSITNERFRWTVKTNIGIKDLDTETVLVLDSLYNITVLYSGSDFEIYINGNLDAFSTFSGLILETSTNFMIGQVLPNDNQYNFKGVLDDIRIYNYALSHSEIRSLYDIVSLVDDQSGNSVPDQTILFQNYPNPFNSQTVISFQIKTAAKVKLEIYNLLGNKVQTLANEYKGAGYYSESWDGNDVNGLQVPTGIYFYRLITDNYTQTKKLLILK